MKKLLLIFLFILSCSSSGIITTPPQKYVPPTKAIETEVLVSINRYRVSLNLTTLLTKDFIKSEAYTHTIYMIGRGEPSHDNFFARRENLVLRGATVVGENVAFGYSSAKTVVLAWINNEGHRDVLEGDYTHFEISIEEDINNKYYFTVIFIKT